MPMTRLVTGALILVLAATRAPANDVASPVAHWPMDGKGPLIQDISGNGFTGTITGVQRIGRQGQGALCFGGAGFVELTEGEDGRLSLDDGEEFSITLWVNLSASRGVRGTHTLAGKGGQLHLNEQWTEQAA